VRLGHLHHDEAAGPAQLAGPGDGPVGALDRIDGQHRALLDGHRLADVEPAGTARSNPVMGWSGSAGMAVNPRKKLAPPGCNSRL
jgi:hypothetical protein